MTNKMYLKGYQAGYKACQRGSNPKYRIPVEDISQIPSYHGTSYSRWYGEGDGYDDDGNIILDEWFCGVCGHHFEEWEEEPTWNYCPICGNIMRVNKRTMAAWNRKRWKDEQKLV